MDCCRPCFALCAFCAGLSVGRHFFVRRGAFVAAGPRSGIFKIAGFLGLISFFVLCQQQNVMWPMFFHSMNLQPYVFDKFTHKACVKHMMM